MERLLSANSFFLTVVAKNRGFLILLKTQASNKMGLLKNSKIFGLSIQALCMALHAKVERKTFDPRGRLTHTHKASFVITIFTCSLLKSRKTNQTMIHSANPQSRQ